MKKIFTPFLFLALFNSTLLANKDDNLTKLFDKTKFPVSDYIYKAGFKEPEIKDLKQEFEESFENKKQEISTKTAQTNEANNTNINDDLNKIKDIKEKVKTKQQELQTQIAQEQSYSKQRKIKRLIRDEILANRNIAIKEKGGRFGDDKFSNQESIDISTNEHRLYRMIRAGRLIPALLTSSISSDLSGIVTAQIEQDIYASMGKAVLIPRGSKAIGFYENNNQIGHNRLQITWREIITPQGINILLKNATTTDNMGISGATGSLNNKYFERYGIAYSISTITNGILLAIASNMDANNIYAQEIYSNARSDIGTIIEDIISQQSKIKPTVEIKSGSRIFLVSSNHMWFSKPKNGEVLMKFFRD